EQPDRERRPQENRSDPRVHPLLDDESENCRETQGHGEPVPKKGVVVWIPVIVGRTDAGKKNAKEEDNSCGMVPESPQPSGSARKKGEVRDNVPEVGDAEDGSLVGELMVALILLDRRQQQQCRQ